MDAGYFGGQYSRGAKGVPTATRGVTCPNNGDLEKQYSLFPS